MNEHPVKGEEILKDVDQLARERPLIRHHHEWFNGSGYPDRLIGEEIPLLARVLHVADAFEAMTASRPYRTSPAHVRREALAELRRYAGIQFDPSGRRGVREARRPRSTNRPVGTTREPERRPRRRSRCSARSRSARAASLTSSSAPAKS